MDEDEPLFVPPGTGMGFGGPTLYGMSDMALGGESSPHAWARMHAET